MTVYSRLDLYSDYLHKPLNIDVNWEVQVNMIINKWYLKTTNDVYVMATKYSHEIGYVIIAVVILVVGFIAYKGLE